MNSKNNKKYISLIILIIILIISTYFAYNINYKIKNYKNNFVVDANRLSLLEKEKKLYDLYNKMSVKDSKEALEIQKYILSDNKILLNLINELETYTKKINISDQESPILSVSKRENADLTKYHAEDVVIDMKVSGSKDNVEKFLYLLDNIPYVSYIEKMNLNYDNMKGVYNCSISLVIYQKNENK